MRKPRRLQLPGKHGMSPDGQVIVSKNEVAVRQELVRTDGDVAAASTMMVSWLFTSNTVDLT